MSRSVRITLATLFLALALTAGCSLRSPGRSAAEAVLRFDGGAASPEELVESYLDGLRRKDEVGLRRLAVNEHEYLTILLPGTVPPGAPLADMPMKKREYFWAANHTRSQYALLARLGEFGGQEMKLKEIRYPKPPQPFALYTALRNPLIIVEKAGGEEDEIELGSIIEVGGRYKFASFFWD
jgi:hypothetical protein